jgi:cell division protein FtsW
MKAATTILFFCVVALLALGMVMLFSASTGQPGAKYLIQQPVWCGLGLIICWVAALGDYRWLKKKSFIPWAVWGLALALLGLVLVRGIGITRNGATRWLGVGSWSVQPSEFAKIALIILLAWYGEQQQRKMPHLGWGLLLPALLIAPVLALIFREPDWGTMILLATVSGVMLFLAGTHPLVLSVTGLASVGMLIRMILHDPVRRDRWLGFLDPEKYKDTVFYQTWQSMVAIGSGGVTGLGLGDGRQKLGFVPEHHTDFIFSVIGEELGMVAGLLVVLAFLAIVVAGIYIAWRSPDTFGVLLAAGITSLIAFQAAINIAVVTGSLPNKGLPLPFISYGGSNLVLMLGCVGLLLNVARHAAEPEMGKSLPGLTGAHVS